MQNRIKHNFYPGILVSRNFTHEANKHPFRFPRTHNWCLSGCIDISSNLWDEQWKFEREIICYFIPLRKIVFCWEDLLHFSSPPVRSSHRSQSHGNIVNMFRFDSLIHEKKEKRIHMRNPSRRKLFWWHERIRQVDLSLNMKNFMTQHKLVSCNNPLTTNCCNSRKRISQCLFCLFSGMIIIRSLLRPAGNSS